MVVGYNEEKLLTNCLQSLFFCDEILYTDLGSSDNSISIAKKFTDKIYYRDKATVPSCEMAQTEVVHYTKNDWVVFIDPDEVIDKILADEIILLFEKICNEETIGAVYVPWHFYFKMHKLIGTIWGGNNQKHLLVNKNKFNFLPIIHYGRQLKNGYKNYFIPLNKENSNILHHYWMNSYTVFIKKHQRYLKNEGQDEYDRGRRSSLRKIVLSPFKEFYFSLITKQGYQDYFIGLFLSIFWAYYKTCVTIAVYKVQRKVGQSQFLYKK
jgi:hypothetical protein